MGAVHSFSQILLMAHSLIGHFLSHWYMPGPVLGSGALELELCPGQAHCSLPQGVSGRPRTGQCFSGIGDGGADGMEMHYIPPPSPAPSLKSSDPLGSLLLFFNLEKLFTWRSHRNVARNPYVSFPHSPNVNVSVLHSTILT